LLFDALPDEEIVTSAIPPLSEDFFARATLQVDSDLWAWFQAQGDECERRINAALRIYAEAHSA
jgi:uncharacterized protein (DUF4415 family)